MTAVRCDGFDLAIRLVWRVLELGQRPQGFFGRIRGIVNLRNFVDVDA
jgi:hypothetical protein